MAGAQGAAAAHPELETITLSTAPAAVMGLTSAVQTGQKLSAATQAAAGAAMEGDARRQALRDALGHLEQAVDLLKRALDVG